MLAFLRHAPSPLFGRRGVDLDFPMLAGCLALLGLGLVIARDIARDMGGDLRHVANGGKGAAFELTLRPAGEVP